MKSFRSALMLLALALALLLLGKAPIDEKQLKEANIRVATPPPVSKPPTPDVHGVVHKNIGRVQP